MRTKEQITEQLNGTKQRYQETKIKYMQLSQIDMLSGTGNSLLAQINRMVGIQTALEWVLEEDENDKGSTSTELPKP